MPLIFAAWNACKPRSLIECSRLLSAGRHLKQNFYGSWSIWYFWPAVSG